MFFHARQSSDYRAAGKFFSFRGLNTHFFSRQLFIIFVNRCRGL